MAGRTYYKSEDKIGCTKKWGEFCEHPEVFPSNKINQNCTYTACQYHSSQKFVKMLLDRGHHDMIEFGDIIVRFVTNRGVTHELVRHRLCSFAQESTRYVRYDGGMEFIRPVWCSEKLIGLWDFDNPESEANTPAFHDLLSPEWVFFDNCCKAENDYKYLIKHKWRPEQAREMLPNSLKTEIVVKGNIREWRHMFTLRCSKKAHPQIRALMLPLLAELKQKVPVVFDDIFPAAK